MYRESILNGRGMCSDSDKMIAALEKEISDYNIKIQALTEISNLEISGESAEALKEKNDDLIHIIEKLIEADKLDIRDFKALKERVGDTYINGEEVLDNIETARRGASECYDRADSLWQAAQKATYPWEADSLRGMSYSSKSQGERWDRIKDFWIGRANLYDEIDNDTASLFTESLLLHRQAGIMLNQFMQCRLTAKTTKSNLSRNLVGSNAKRNEAVEYAKDYLKQHGMTDEEIAKIDSNLLSSLYATLHWSTRDSILITKGILKKIYGYLIEGKYDGKDVGDILYKLFINNRLDDLKKAYLDDNQEEYNKILDDVGIDKSENLEIKYDITIPDKVEGVFSNGETIILNPRKDWAMIGGGEYGSGLNVDSEGRYIVAVGPKILVPDYPDDGKIWASDFVFPAPIDVYLRNKKTGEIKEIHCVVEDVKAHTYNSCNELKFEGLENGTIQTGIPYPGTRNIHKFEPENIDASVIEFCGSEVDFPVYDYELEGIVIVEKEE